MRLFIFATFDFQKRSLTPGSLNAVNLLLLMLSILFLLLRFSHTINKCAHCLPYLWRPGSSAEASLPTILLCSWRRTEVSFVTTVDRKRDLQKNNTADEPMQCTIRIKRARVTLRAMCNNKTRRLNYLATSASSTTRANSSKYTTQMAESKFKR